MSPLFFRSGVSLCLLGRKNRKGASGLTHEATRVRPESLDIAGLDEWPFARRVQLLPLYAFVICVWGFFIQCWQGSEKPRWPGQKFGKKLMLLGRSFWKVIFSGENTKNFSVNRNWVCSMLSLLAFVIFWRKSARTCHLRFLSRASVSSPLFIFLFFLHKCGRRKLP
jgi:hypothetical protein